MNFISFENRKNCTPTILSKTVCVYFRRRLCSSSLGVHDKRTWAPALQPSTKVLLKRHYLHAARASLHQPKYSLKRCNLHVAFALHIIGFDVHPFFSSHAYDNTNKKALSPRSNQSTPQTALSSCSWRLAPPTKVLR